MTNDELYEELEEMMREYGVDALLAAMQAVIRTEGDEVDEHPELYRAVGIVVSLLRGIIEQHNDNLADIKATFQAVSHDVGTLMDRIDELEGKARVMRS